MYNIKFENIIIWVLFSLALIAIATIEFIFANEPENWQYGSELGNVISRLSLAYIASGIFYWLVVYLARKRDKRNIYKHVIRISESIVFKGDSLLNGIRDIDSLLVEDHELSKEEFFDMCSKIRPNTIQNFFITPDVKYPVYYKDHINNIIKGVRHDAQSLFNYISHLDTKHINLVNDILFCKMMTSFNAFFSNEIYTKNYASFKPLSGTFYDFYLKVQSLKKYNQGIKL